MLKGISGRLSNFAGLVSKAGEIFAKAERSGVAVCSAVAVAVGSGMEVAVGKDVGMLVGIDIGADGDAICFADVQAVKSVIVKMKIRDRFMYMLFSQNNRTDNIRLYNSLQPHHALIIDL